MNRPLLLGLASGAMTASSVAHFVKGVTAEPYPTVFGSSPTTNVVTGWAGLVASGLLAHHAIARGHRYAAEFAGASGALVAGLYHARGGPARLHARIGR